MIKTKLAFLEIRLFFSQSELFDLVGVSRNINPTAEIWISKIIK